MKSAIIATLLAAVVAASPHGLRAILDPKPWKEMDWYQLTHRPVSKLHELKEDVIGTYLYCKTFDSENHADGPYESYRECMDDHKKRDWLQPKPTQAPPCNKDNGYPEETCGTKVYCEQYDVKGDQPFPAIYDDSADCFFFHNPPPAPNAM